MRPLSTGCWVSAAHRAHCVECPTPLRQQNLAHLNILPLPYVAPKTQGILTLMLWERDDGRIHRSAADRVRSFSVMTEAARGISGWSRQMGQVVGRAAHSCRCVRSRRACSAPSRSAAEHMLLSSCVHGMTTMDTSLGWSWCGQTNSTVRRAIHMGFLSSKREGLPSQGCLLAKDAAGHHAREAACS